MKLANLILAVVAAHSACVSIARADPLILTGTVECGVYQVCNDDIIVDNVTLIPNGTTGSRTLVLRAINGKIDLGNSIDPRGGSINGNGTDGAPWPDRDYICSSQGDPANTGPLGGFAITIETLASAVGCPIVPARSRDISVGSQITVNGGAGRDAKVGWNEVFLAEGTPCCPTVNGGCPCNFGATNALAGTSGASAGSVTIRGAGNIIFGPTGSISAKGGRGGNGAAGGSAAYGGAGVAQPGLEGGKGGSIVIEHSTTAPSNAVCHIGAGTVSTPNGPVNTAAAIESQGGDGGNGASAVHGSDTPGLASAAGKGGAASSVSFSVRNMSLGSVQVLGQYYAAVTRSTGGKGGNGGQGISAVPPAKFYSSCDNGGSFEPCDEFVCCNEKCAGGYAGAAATGGAGGGASGLMTVKVTTDLSMATLTTIGTFGGAGGVGGVGGGGATGLATCCPTECAPMAFGNGASGGGGSGGHASTVKVSVGGLLASAPGALIGSMGGFGGAGGAGAAAVIACNCGNPPQPGYTFNGRPGGAGGAGGNGGAVSLSAGAYSGSQATNGRWGSCGGVGGSGGQGGGGLLWLGSPVALAGAGGAGGAPGMPGSVSGNAGPFLNPLPCPACAVLCDDVISCDGCPGTYSPFSCPGT